MNEYKSLIGRTLIEVEGMHKGSERVALTFEDGSILEMVHDQNCCENVEVEDVVGDIRNLMGVPIVRFDEVSSHAEADDEPYSYDSITWTFYSITTLRGTVVLRWLGRSNGYYSERVDLYLDSERLRVDN